MPTGPFRVVTVQGQRRSDKRAVAFLERDDDPALNARAVFEALSEKRTREVRTRFDYWIDGFPRDNYFHGWPNQPEYKGCFVFKYQEQRRNCRFYGFLHHPLKKRRAFQVCVLASHAIKPGWNTDPRELNAMNALRVDGHVIAAIEMVFSDEKAEATAWLN